ncbi:transcription antitermination factor NusB [Pseudomonas aeruginosa]
MLYTRIPPHAAIGETVGCADKLKKGWAKGVLNAVLRRARAKARRCWPRSTAHPLSAPGHPRWLLKALKQAGRSKLDALCAANNAHPPDDRGLIGAAASAMPTWPNFRRSGIEARAVSYSRDGIQLAAPRDVARTYRASRRAASSVQDEAA